MFLNAYCRDIRQLTRWLPLAVLLLGPMAIAGSVRQQLSSRDGWVDTPITVDFLFEDVQSHTPPIMPSVPGLTITSSGPPSSVNNSFSLNGRRTTHSVLTYRYLVTASEPGTYTLPSINLFADDTTWSAEPVVLTFQSTADPNLLQAELLHIPEHAWLGDVIPVTLRILAKPFADTQLTDGALSAADMWRLVQLDISAWGPFRDRLEQLASTQRFPALSVVEVASPSGVPDRWYAFDLRIDMPLVQAGMLDLTDIRVVMSYPIRIGRGRTSFLNPIPSLTITQSRTVSASPPPTELLVESPPQSGRPPTWAGAVGDFRFDVTASHTDTTVGEPITLTMKITDIGPHAADLDLLQAPRLGADAALTSHFRVPVDRPGGVVKGRTKTFTQTIRPTSSGVDLVPPIPFTFFDPKTGTYDTAFSRPIDIAVTGARQVDAADVGGVSPLASPTSNGVTSVQGGLLANYTDADQLLARKSPASGAVFAGVVFAPPLAFVLIAGMRRRQAASQRDPNRARARRAARVLSERLSQAKGSPEGIAAAIRGFIADRLGLPATGLTRGEAVEALRTTGHDDMASIVDEALRNLEQRIYAGTMGEPGDAATQELAALCGQLEDALR